MLELFNFAVGVYELPRMDSFVEKYVWVWIKEIDVWMRFRPHTTLYLYCVKEDLHSFEKALCEMLKREDDVELDEKPICGSVFVVLEGLEPLSKSNTADCICKVRKFTEEERLNLLPTLLVSGIDFEFWGEALTL